MPSSVYGRILKHKGDLGQLHNSCTYIWTIVGGIYGALAAFILEGKYKWRTLSVWFWLAGIGPMTAGAWKPYIQSQGSLPLAT